MKVICVTGSPGTGKTAIAKKLALKYNLYYLDVNRIINKYKLSSGYDRKRKTKIVDTDKLNKKLIDIIEFFKKHHFIGNALMSKARSTITLKKENIKQKYKGIVIDSHLSHCLPKKYVNLCIVAKCDIKELNKRLKKRRYSKDKVKENMQAEIFDVCYNEAIMKKHKVFVIDTTKGFNINKIKLPT